MLVIGLLYFLLYAALVFYIGWSGWRWISPKAGTVLKYVYIAVIIAVASSFMLGRWTQNVLIEMFGAYWMAVFYLLLLLLPLVQLVFRLLRFTRLPRQRARAWEGLATLILLTVFLAYGLFNAYSPVVRTYDIHIEKPESPSGSLNIVAASDTHFGVLSGKGHAERLVREINALDPDLVMFPGDLLDDAVEPFVDQGIDRILAQIDAEYGVYASLGNHDRHDGSMQELIGALERSGMKVLADERVTVGGADGTVTLIGRKDLSDPGRAGLSDLMEGVDRSKPVIVLDHQPYELDEASRQGVDLLLSGHTHRGQIFPGNLLTGIIYENDWGHLQKGTLHSVVTSGYGFWGPPIRIGTRSEIVRIRLTFGP